MSTTSNLAAAAARLQMTTDELSRMCSASGLTVAALERLSASQREFWKSYARDEGYRVSNRAPITAHSSAEIRTDTLQKLCAMYGVPEALTRDIVKAHWPVATVAQMLQQATGDALAIGPAGIGYCQFRLGFPKMERAS